MRTDLDMLLSLSSLYGIKITPTHIKQLTDAYTNLLSLRNTHRNLADSVKFALRMDNYVIVAYTSYYSTRGKAQQVEIFLQEPVDEDGKSDQYRPYENRTTSNVLEDFVRNTFKNGEAKYIVESSQYSPGIKDVRLATESLLEDIDEIETLNTAMTELYNTNSGETHVIGDLSDLHEILYPDSKQHASVNTLKKTLYTYILANYPELNCRGNYKSITYMRNLIQLLMPKDAKHTTMDVPTDVGDIMSDYNQRMRLITDVWEIDNKRFALSAVAKYNNRYRGNNGAREYDSRLIILNHEHVDYNFVDIGRITFTDHGDGSREIITEEKPLGKAYIMDSLEDIALPKGQVLEEVVNTLPHRAATHRLLQADLENAATRLMRRNTRTKSKETAREKAWKVKEKINERITNLDEEGKFLKINDVTYTKNSITYLEQVLTFDGTGDNWVIGLLTRLNRNWNTDQITFDHAFTAYLSLIKEMLGSGIVGEVNFEITEKGSTNTLGVTSYRRYINDCRINAGEIEACVRRALCFTTQSDFDSFLKSVSKCSLLIHSFLQTGIDLAVSDYFTGKGMSIKLPLERKRGINYLVINDGEYRVRDTQKLIGLQSKHDLVEVMKTLLNPAIITGITVDEIKGIIEAAVEAYVTAEQRSVKLLRETEELLKVKVDDVKLGNGKTIRGYLVKGSRANYVIEVDRGDLTEGQHTTYNQATGQAYCIVDKGSKAQVGMDKLVNRLFALSNDSLVAGQIHTI